VLSVTVSHNLISLQVLKDLPNKSERIEWCDMTDLQRSIYRETLQRSRKTILEAEVDDSDAAPSAKPSNKSRPAPRQKDKLYSENSSNVLMDLRKAASHPMLFRTRFTDETLTGITKQLLKEADFKKRGAIFELVKEDMSVMTDSELQVFCASYKVRPLIYHPFNYQ
jgi:SWI/SNF-related matrix-associated actin-dependent regulator 1 of chromatin subfamily A